MKKIFFWISICILSGLSFIQCDGGSETSNPYKFEVGEIVELPSNKGITGLFGPEAVDTTEDKKVDGIKLTTKSTAPEFKFLNDGTKDGKYEVDTNGDGNLNIYLIVDKKHNVSLQTIDGKDLWLIINDAGEVRGIGESGSETVSIGIVNTGGGSSDAPVPTPSPAGKTDSESVTTDKTALAITFGSGNDANNVTQNLTLPTSGANGTTISWASSNTGVIASNGTVTRPAAGSSDVTVTLTATIAKSGVTETKTFTVIVKAAGSSNLGGVTINKGVLQPAFSSSVTDYLIAPVAFADSVNPTHNATQSIQISMTADTGSTIKINGTTVASGTAHTINNLAVGPNTVTVVITADDGVNTKTYNIVVYRAIPIFKTGAGTVTISGYTHDPREDGSTQKGVSWPSPRFSTSGDTVIDNMTGLIWLKATDSTTRVWTANIDYSEGLTAATFSDWRLPNVLEFMSLINFGATHHSNYFNNALQGFSNVSAISYHSSTPSGTDHKYINLGTGITCGTGSSSNSNRAWQVRGSSNILPVTGNTVSKRDGDDAYYKKGVPFPTIRFKDNGNGTITDNMTGLIWLKDAGTAGQHNWADALGRVDALNTANESGYNDWRLPSVSELATLIHYGKEVAPALADWLMAEGFTNVKKDNNETDRYSYYWTSTTNSCSAVQAYRVIIRNGSIVMNDKTTVMNVWLVRGGN